MLANRRLRSAVLGTTLVACCFATAAAEKADSILLVNHDFESTDAHAAWKEMVPKGAQPSKVSLDTNNAHSGKAALKFQATADRKESSFLFSGVTLPTERAKRIRIRFYARTSGIEAGKAELNVLERDRTKVLGWTDDKQALMPIDAGSEWKEFTAEVPLRDETQVLTLFLRIQDPTGDKIVWLDDLSIEFVEPQ